MNELESYFMNDSVGLGDVIIVGQIKGAAIVRFLNHRRLKPEVDTLVVDGRKKKFPYLVQSRIIHTVSSVLA